MKPRRSRSLSRGCLPAVLVLAAMLVLAGSYVWLYGNHLGPILARASPAGPPAADPYTLSPEQQAVVGELGYPDSFTLLFYQDRDEADQLYDVRYECWHYDSVGREIVFVNGEEIGDETVEPLGPSLGAAPYRPEQFVASMRLKEVLASAGVTEYVRAAAEPALVAAGEVYFASQLTFGMKAGRLMAVETVPLEAEG